MRDNKWLEEKMYELWEEYFVDVPRKNRVLIKFSKKSYRQLGCIKWATKKTRGIQKLLEKNPVMEDNDERVSLILISGYFKDPKIPDNVVLGTIAHELCHYTHGFNSPLNQIYDHPHKGGVIKKEMGKRGLSWLYEYAEKWLENNWPKYVHNKKNPPYRFRV